jgi:hypothetical protein
LQVLSPLRQTAIPFTSVRILPSQAQIIPIVRGNSKFFTLDHPDQFAVDFCAAGDTCTETNDTDLMEVGT